MKDILFDSHAILKFYQDERGADKIERFLTASRERKLCAHISEINLGEVYYLIIRRVGLKSARNILEQFSELGISVVSLTSDIIRSASEIKAEHAISYADCFAVATAMKINASLITGDPEFKKVAHYINILWI